MKRFWNSLATARFKKVRLDDAVTPNAFIGKSVVANLGSPTGQAEKIVIQSILGSRAFEKCFEINGSHLCNMFSFYTQLLEGRLPTEEEMAEFELATQIKKIRSLDGKEEKPAK